jgi:hypothetical protein
MCLASAKDKFSEIFIVCDENSFLRGSSIQDDRVIGLGDCLSYSQHIVTQAAEEFDDGSACGLINNELHGGRHLGSQRENVFVGQHVGSIGQSGTDIIGLQSRILLQNLTFRYTLSQHPHNEFNRNTGASNNRFAHHDFGVDAHTLPKLFVHSLLPHSEGY